MFQPNNPFSVPFQDDSNIITYFNIFKLGSINLTQESAQSHA